MKKKEADVVASAREFVAALRPQDKLAVVLFADRAVFAHDLSENREAALAALDRLPRQRRDVALRCACGLAAPPEARAGPPRRRRDDGRPGREQSRYGPGQRQAIRRRGQAAAGDWRARVRHRARHQRRPGSARSDRRLSGGRAFFPTDVSELPAEYRRVVDDLRRRYVVGYTSSHIQRDGSWRNVEIRIKDRPTATVRSAGGYVAPSQ